MQFGAAHDWRDRLEWEVPTVVAAVAPGEPTRCSVCGGASEPLAREELWAVKHRHPTNHHGFVRFYCHAHVPARQVAPEPAAVPAARARTAPRRERAAAPAAAPRRPAPSDQVRAMCPECFVEISATGVCGICGTRVA